jgi:hypothetical protein
MLPGLKAGASQIALDGFLLPIFSRDSLGRLFGAVRACGAYVGSLDPGVNAGDCARKWFSFS